MASASGSKDPTTASLLLSTLGAYSELARHLFASIESPSQSKTRTITDAAADRSWKLRSIPDVLGALGEVDALLASRIELAHVHATNQARIEQLQARARRRDRETRQAILELSHINAELAEITRLSEDELASIARAEERPVGHETLLTYAQRLAKYTSAPPGYKLPQLATAGPDAQVKREQKQDAADGQDKEITLGSDYNQYAKKAAAYYDPAIPSMPQEMPFPSDAMMRQGILNSADMLAGAPMAEQPADDVAMDEHDELPVADFAASYSQLREQQHRQDEDEDAFDLDLN